MLVVLTPDQRPLTGASPPRPPARLASGRADDRSPAQRLLLLLVAGLIAASAARDRDARRPMLGLDLKGGVAARLPGRADPADAKVDPGRAAARGRHHAPARQPARRLRAEIQTSGGNQISVGLPDVTTSQRAEQLVGTTARLEFYDWEANALTPERQDGRQPAPGRRTRRRVEISQGTARRAGRRSRAPAALALYQAVKLAAKQPPAARHRPDARSAGPRVLPVRRARERRRARRGRTAVHRRPAGRAALLLAGRRPPSARAPRSCRRATATRSCRPRASRQDDSTVPQGTVVLQAGPESFSNATGFDRPRRPQFYVLSDHVALFGNEITNPQQVTDSAGSPDVDVRLHRRRAATRSRTSPATIAQRGQLDSGLGQTRSTSTSRSRWTRS